jgi:hypothetical protein
MDSELDLDSSLKDVCCFVVELPGQMVPIELDYHPWLIENVKGTKLKK